MASHTLSPYLSFQLFDLEHLGKIIDRAAARSLLSTCSYESESAWGACDGEPCGDPGLVTDLSTEQTLCPKHFRKLALDAALAELEAR